MLILKLTTIILASIYSCKAICQAPNGTDTKFVWKSCDVDGPIIFHGVTLLDHNSKEVYPILATKPFTVLANITNTGEEYNHVETSMKLYKWGGWFGCSWHRIPTFGILDNIVRCGKGVKCPIMPGKQQLPITIDLGAIGFFVKMLPNEVPYRIIFDIFAPIMNAHACMEIWTVVKTVDD